MIQAYCVLDHTYHKHIDGLYFTPNLYECVQGPAVYHINVLQAYGLFPTTNALLSH